MDDNKRMTDERLLELYRILLELYRKAYGQGGGGELDLDLMETCNEINWLWHRRDAKLRGGLKDE